MADQSMVEAQEKGPSQQLPIVETDDAVSYLGVRLPKAQNRGGHFVPKREAYADYDNDPDLALPMQKIIAVSFLQGDPLLIEGGTEIGKTTTVRKMASELGWEVHYANLNGATDVEDLMGRYIPNPQKKTPADPEYLFADGKVTSGLRQEDGRVKVIILDELNAAAPNVLIRLHEVLDSLQRGENVVLTEDASEALPVDKNVTKIVALMNPPGKGYFGREPLDPAQLRRWVYYKAPTDLPKEAFSHSLNALSGKAVSQLESSSAFLPTRDQALLVEQLGEVPGFMEVWQKYGEFHRGAKQLLKERKLAADQPQPFTFGDRTEPRRVRDFVLQFYNGDINQTVQTALHYYYSNKLESDVDRAQLEELIRHVEYVPPQNVSQRRGADREEVTPEVSQPLSDPEVLVPERDAWRGVLGANMEVKPVPSFVTPEVRRNLERFGFEIRSMPIMDLGTLDDLKTKGVAEFLKDLEKRYPKWKRYESLSSEEREDHAVTRNLEEFYWEQVKNGNVDFPRLPGVTLAVETMPKPAWGEKYDRSPITETLDFEDRFSVTWDDATAAMERKKAKILSDLGLPSGLDIRLLEAEEWNLLGNREGWGKTNSYEWTNTEYRGDGDSRRLVVGLSGDGGASYVDWDHPAYSRDRIGFRLAVVIGS